ncbi:hypothetical protein [Paractinoplanes globisporus]|uniref:DUF4386 family protein n=1 Tax=Paractinoplanes globisporus TaxID=113565 RepID=A0ABW6WAD9_9ACTN|nr:hypothetical protein [Actinoplanes globisporus]
MDTEAPSRLSRIGWLLALSPALSLVWVTAVVTTMSRSGVDQAADLTQGQMDAIRVGWAVQWVLYAVVVIVISAGLAELNRVLRRQAAGLAVASQIAVVVSVLAVVAVLALRLAAIGFSEAHLGDNDAYTRSLAASYVCTWAAAVATVSTSLALRTSGLLRRTGSIVAVLSAVFLALDVATLAVPPWLFAFLWLAIGVGCYAVEGLPRRDEPEASVTGLDVAVLCGSRPVRSRRDCRWRCPRSGRGAG